MSKAAVLMVQGTASDVGKSMLVAALCRIFTEDGCQAAPFKSQNMANNSYVTADGKEIGRAQGMQAEACGIAATTDMNPILIKPTGDMHSQIVVHGRPYAQMSAWKYREGFLTQAKELVMDALDRLRGEYDIVIMEGAGSPAEINLKNRDIVNMNLAGWADSPVLLIADIDRGGVFAAIVGTLELLEPYERARIKGFIINKFRGDLALLQPGLDWLEERTGIPVIGVLPYDSTLHIEAEDSLALQSKRSEPLPERALDIAVIRYPRISNFTDLDILEAEPDVSVRYIEHAHQLGQPDVVILPGSKDTLSDLQFVKESGLETALNRLRSDHQVQVVGICGGYQMLGKQLHDPHGLDSLTARSAAGLGWLPLSTTFLKDKRTIRVHGSLHPAAYQQFAALYDSSDDQSPVQAESLSITGYEIHMGQTICEQPDQFGPLFVLSGDDEQQVEGARWRDGCIHPDGTVWGTYLHGIFDNDQLRRGWLNRLRQQKGMSALPLTVEARSYRQQSFKQLAELVRQHLNMEQIYRILQR